MNQFILPLAMYEFLTIHNFTKLSHYISFIFLNHFKIGCTHQALLSYVLQNILLHIHSIIIKLKKVNFDNTPVHIPIMTLQKMNGSFIVSLDFHYIPTCFLKNFIEFARGTLVNKIMVSGVQFHNTASVYCISDFS